ncbi:CotH kinase family protein [Nonomuraea cavernae]|uniref:Spore coat protein CotH n=1 Tax=Nonomuraea cavernae TaxID=2045107 RepID=A0A918DEZ8_9ACTN|nr:CotH kinase family protein [Nonomuraea cavernae]MCA2183763.1 CotH kinase family protein [Nonomuraea cavernae]GGO61291.1 hypothetical protein GCM10012289_03170 [Nonomuraea cavernae]
MDQPTNRRRLRHRVPIRLRQHWKLVAACLTFLAVCAGVFGTGTIRPYVTRVQTASADTVTQNVTGAKELFDTSVPHEVKLTFRDESYQDMLQEYFKDGDKKYVEADLTIDGTTIPSVGIRLKGNSTLSGLSWNGQTRQRGMPGGGRRLDGGQPPEGLPEGLQPPEGFQPPGNGRPQGQDQPPGGGGFPGGAGGSLKAEEPETLPWLISFDEFVEGRRYQGHSQIAVRPGAMRSTTLLNESLAISLVDAAGEPTQRFAYSAFEVNGRTTAPRLLVEYLDEDYASRLGTGVLYKSLASSDFSYKGEDQTEYTEDFKQVNRKGEQDLQPVIGLVKWVEQASDEEFAAGLADRLDVESFARYLVLQNLMLNFDDMSGPGRNYYLWYDLDSRKFQVISWDLNLVFSGDAEAGPHDTIGMGFGARRPDGQQPTTQTPDQQQSTTRTPDRQQRQPTAQTPGQRQPGGERPGGMRMGHALKDRFLATPAFKQSYEEQYRDLYAKLLENGTALKLLDGVLDSYGLNERADTANATKEATALRTTLQTRAKALGADKTITGS